MKKTKKFTICIILILLVSIIASIVLCFLFIPRKTSEPLLPITIECMDKYPSFVSGGVRVVPRKSLLLYLKNNITLGGNKDNNYAHKYNSLYNTKGIYVKLTDIECLELYLSGGSRENAVEAWKQGHNVAWQIFLDGNGEFQVNGGGDATNLIPPAK